MSKQIIQFQAQVDGLNKKKDNTISIKLGTQELSAEDAAYIFDMSGIVYVGMKELPLAEDDLDIPEVADTDTKSPSQRLRAVLYRNWEKVDNGTKKTFEQFYRDYMERLINGLKDKLE